MLLDEEDIEDLKQNLVWGQCWPDRASQATHLLLADQAVVHGLVGAVAVESDRNVVLESELLHQHGLLEGSHQSCLHRNVEIRIRDLGGKKCVNVTMQVLVVGFYLPECFEPYSKWGRPSPQCSDISVSCSTRTSRWPHSTACWSAAPCSRPRCCTSPPPGPSGHTRCSPRPPPRPSAWTCSRGCPTPSGRTSSATRSRGGNPHCSSHRAPGETTVSSALDLTPYTAKDWPVRRPSIHWGLRTTRCPLGRYLYLQLQSCCSPDGLEFGLPAPE